MTARFTRAAAVLAVLTIGAALGPPVAGAGDPARTTRTATKKVAPAYPEMARKGRLEGTVKLSVLVALDGKVKTVNVIGGHPVLVMAASTAARQWKFEPAARESSETIVFDFQRPE